MFHRSRGVGLGGNIVYAPYLMVRADIAHTIREETKLLNRVRRMGTDDRHWFAPTRVTGRVELETVQPPLLQEDEPPPFSVIAGSETSPYLITCDHAGRELPRELGTLGLSRAELDGHIAWDIGAGGVARRLATELDAFLIMQPYSRLVIDCNRPLDAPSSIAQHSEYTVVPGNQRVSAPDAEMRARSIFHPYHHRIRCELERRATQGQPTIFIAMHSFTPTFMSVARPWHIGVLYNRDSRLGRILLELLGRETALVVGDNEPYAASDQTDYGIVQYGERRGNPHVELEIRQDLIADDAGQTAWAELLARLFREASTRSPS